MALGIEEIFYDIENCVFAGPEETNAHSPYSSRRQIGAFKGPKTHFH